MNYRVTPGVLVLILLAANALFADDGQRLLSIDHYVPVRSTVPAIAGQIAQIYVREVVLAGAALRNRPSSDNVVLFVHGAGTPAEVAFDVPYEDYSWMRYLARAGFDVFAMDMTGYGRSTRPAPMNDLCNLSPEQQAGFIPGSLSKVCTPSYPHRMTTIASDWNDIGAVVDHLRSLRSVERVSLIGWSLGGPRAGGYAAQYPDKINKVVLLSPAYRTSGPGAAPQIPADGPTMGTQSLAEFNANWDNQIGCPDQYDESVRKVVWSEMLASDPLGSTWGTGVRRAPQVASWGWNQSVVTKVQTPVLLIAAANDKQVQPQSVRELLDDLGSREKVLLDLACSSHNALWERNHLLLFKSSADWLAHGNVKGSKQGIVRLGY